jgi:integral membrane sensor domain MASE1
MIAIGFRDKQNTYVARFIIFLALAVLFVKLGLWTAVPPYFISAIWPAIGVATGICIVWGLRYLPAISIAFFTGLYFHNYSAVELLISPVRIAFYLSIISTLAIVLKVVVYKWIMKKEDILNSISSLIKMVFLFIVLSAFALIALLVFSHYFLIIPSSLTFIIILKWTGADLAGTLIFIPFFLTIGRSGFNTKTKKRVYEYFVLAVFPLVIFGLSFFENFLTVNTLALIIIPYLLLINYRYSIQVVMIFTIISFYLLSIILLMNTGSYQFDDYIDIIGFCQVFFIMIFIGMLIIKIRA